MINIDISLLYQLVNFLFLIWILNIILYKPVRRVLRERNDQLGGLEADIRGLSEQLAEKAREMEARRNEARLEGFNRKEELKKQGQSVERELLSDASKKTESRISEVKVEIAADIVKARETLKSQVDGFSRALAEKILGRKVA